MTQTFADCVKSAYGAGKVQNMSAIVYGANDTREAGEVMAEMVSTAVELIDGIKSAKAMSTEDREAGAEAQRLCQWVKGLDGSTAPITEALRRLAVR